jgi:radical SAM superfamily enzyme YgiQ (UPF0313 family)
MKTKVLMIYPKIPKTFWNFDYLVPFSGHKAMFPPLGLLTVGALMPENYELKLIDMNAYPLSMNDIKEADIVFISAMAIQQDSFDEVVNLCYECKKPIVAGGAIVWSGFDLGLILTEKKIDHFIFGEAEINLLPFLEDYEKGTPKRLYRSEEKADLTTSPTPRYDLINLDDYLIAPIQFSRGCPFNCEFCDIIEMNGQNVRTKSPEQVINELNAIHNIGYEGIIFFVDDNFIGNIPKTKAMLKELCGWQRANNYPYNFLTQASINIAQDNELLDLISTADFVVLFVGIESPDPNTLSSIHKVQNVRNDMIESVHKIQSKGIMVMGGFIIGFDNDPEDIFDMQINFLQEAGIPIAMVGLLVAMPNTQLYRRLQKENRLIGNGWHTGNNVEVCLNFIPRRDEEELVAGYKRVISEIYKPKNWYRRVIKLLEHMPKEIPKGKPKNFIRITGILSTLRITRILIYLFFKLVFSSYGRGFLYCAYKARKVNKNYWFIGAVVAGALLHFGRLAKRVVYVTSANRQNNA